MKKQSNVKDLLVRQEKKWIVKDPAPSDFKEQLSEYPPVVADLLYQRGIRGKDEAMRFLNPHYETDVYDPFLFKQMPIAVDRIYEAIAAKERIVVHGDYDADGISGAVILVSTLKFLGAEEIDVFLPHREKDGYGVNADTINLLHEQETKLIITCDCGIADIEPITEAKALGMDVIITDHHGLPEKLPPCIILHPKIEGETYPFKHLSGGGVAFKLAQALLSFKAKETGESNKYKTFEKWLLDMVAIASVADMVPLIGENRTLVKYGLLVLSKTKRPGLKAILKQAGLLSSQDKAVKLGAYEIGFVIGPRLNAAGRMFHANASYATLMAEDEEQANSLASNLEQNNRDRRELSDRITKEALQQIGEVPEYPSVLIAQNDSWPLGLVGLVAGRLMEKLHRPVFILGRFDGRIAGSGRSIEGFNCVKALEAAKELLLRYGGHPRACGFTMKNNDQFSQLKEIFQTFAKQSLTKEDLVPTVEIDAELGLSDITWKFCDQLEKFEPFGQENEEPVFIVRDVTVVEARGVGKDCNHLKLVVNDEGKVIRQGIGFGQTFWCENLKPGDKIDLVFTIDVNEFRGNKELQLKISDIRRVNSIIKESQVWMS